MKTRFLMFFIFFVLISLIGCSGLPAKITVHNNNKKSMLQNFNSINLSFKTLETMTPATIIRIKALFEGELIEKNIKLDVNSSISLEVNFKKYEDGNIAARKITGLILGFTLGEPAKIEAKVILKNGEEEVKKIDIMVRSSRNGMNFDAFVGVRNLEQDFVTKTLKNL